jgi:hypothetical protein
MRRSLVAMRRSLVAVLAVLATIATPSGAATHLLVISGLGGEESFSKSFHEWSTSLIDSAVASGVPEANVVYLAEDPARDAERIDGAARKETIESTLLKMGESAGTGGELWIVIFGHGSARGDEATINLPGPDLSGSELAAMIERLPVERVAIANASSASADFVERLSGPGRAIVTATRSISERHAPTFGGFFSEGFKDQRADVDKDERVSLLEAFDYARIAVARAFEEDGRMATEHPMLDDNGDRKGSLEPKATGDADGLLASRLFLGSESTPGASSPELDQLRAKKNELEGRIAELRAQRSGHEEEVYLRELEALLLDLARTNAEIERLAGTGEKPG